MHVDAINAFFCPKAGISPYLIGGLYTDAFFFIGLESCCIGQKN